MARRHHRRRSKVTRVVNLVKKIIAFFFSHVGLCFGDKFPGASVGNDAEAQEKLVITSVYLLFGMALLAMCFNLAQEEVVNKVSWVASKLGVVNNDDDDYD
uniref:Uncharacterized protein n=1 Tax=Plectus sambesii TaxID=2011161 RepID=A0A914VSJ8_9BILA